MILGPFGFGLTCLLAVLLCSRALQWRVWGVTDAGAESRQAARHWRFEVWSFGSFKGSLKGSIGFLKGSLGFGFWGVSKSRVLGRRLL